MHIYVTVVVVLLLAFSRVSRSDTEVPCVYNESCILPCSFQPGDGVEIYWIQTTPENTIVQYFYNNQDKLGDQHQKFRNRTSLFKDQISRGNASLQLTGVKVQDKGRYKCFTRNTTTGDHKTSFIILRVDAPKGNIQQRKSDSVEQTTSRPETTITQQNDTGNNVGVIIIGSVIGLTAAAAVAAAVVRLVMYFKNKKGTKENSRSESTSREMERVGLNDETPQDGDNENSISPSETQWLQSV